MLGCKFDIDLLCARTELSMNAVVPRLKLVPYFTEVFEGISVVQLMLADSLVILATTIPEINGAPGSGFVFVVNVLKFFVIGFEEHS